LTRNGFGGPTGYHLNHEVNARYADAAPGGHVLRLPVLFVGAAYDQVADLASPTMLDAMHSTCPNLTEATIPAGHWLHMEAAPAVNDHIESWLTSHVAEQPDNGRTTHTVCMKLRSFLARRLQTHAPSCAKDLLASRSC